MKEWAVWLTRLIADLELRNKKSWQYGLSALTNISALTKRFGTIIHCEPNKKTNSFYQHNCLSNDELADGRLANVVLSLLPKQITVSAGSGKSQDKQPLFNAIN